MSTVRRTSSRPRSGINADTPQGMIKTDEFLRMEFQTLRKEIEDIHSRMFQLLVGGITIIPAAQALLPQNVTGSNWQELGIVWMLLPGVVVIIVLLFLTQNISIMRCGRYIKEQIEPNVPDILGRETWMERNPLRNRLPDKSIIYTFVILSLLYYVSACWMGLQFVGTSNIPYRSFAIVACGLLYLAVLVATFLFFVRHVKDSHSTNLSCYLPADSKC